MKLLRHILSHLLLILVMFGIVSLYYYRHQLLPVKYAGKIDVYAEKIHPKLKSFTRTNRVNNGVATAEVNSPIEAQTSTVIDNAKEPEKIAEATVPGPAPVLSNPPSEATTSGEVVLPAENIKTEQSVAIAEVPVTVDVAPQEKQDTVVVDKPAASTAMAAPVTEMIETPSEENMVATTDKEAASTDDLLRMARQAFNDGKLDMAITQYNALIVLDNDDADFYGELGNVHYAMGSWKKAGAAYYEAATRLIEKRQFAQIRYLQRVLNGLDAELAEKLSYQLASIN